MKNLNNFLNFLLWAKTMIEELPGQVSTTRTMTCISTISVMAVWVVTSIQTGTIAPLDGSVLTLMGTLWGAKVVQHFSEK